MTLWHGQVVLVGAIRSKKELLQLLRKLHAEAGQRVIIRPQRETKVHYTFRTFCLGAASCPVTWLTHYFFQHNADSVAGTLIIRQR